MKKLTFNQIIRMYIEFFKEKGHLEVESASLIPHDDPSVLWINAGVTPLKKYFDGSQVPKNRRIVSCQKCIRTNDIENVGNTARHHTFFQMLGNFSIGDYFKEEALTWALELLTDSRYFNLDKNKLYVTVYTDDIVAYSLWVKLGIDESHIVKLKGNYWEIGEGPSGPDSEIFYDRGSKYDPANLGIKLLEEEVENDRYIEIWNNVFSQYNAKAGVPRDQYEELPSKNIDTGMGVERMACILQETETNYETDLFMPIIKEIEKLALVEYLGQKEFKVIADHIRTLVFAISDGATFENYGRGYVLRRILRRAVRMGRKLNINSNFMTELVEITIDTYKEIYPEIVSNKSLIKDLITKEEELFHKTLLSGEKRLEEIFATSDSKIISGENVFKLYDTYGFPVELTKEIASEKGFKIDEDGFEKFMHIQKEKARNSRKQENSMNIQNEVLIGYNTKSDFVGYDNLEVTTKILDIIDNNNFVDSCDHDCHIVLEENPFYAESGGQVSDSGFLKNDKCKLEVIEVIKAPNKQHLLYVKVLEGTIEKDSQIIAHVLKSKRDSIMKNHSAVHLIQKSLQDLLGDNVHQAGSKVDEKHFRFDFVFHGKLSDQKIIEVEEKANNRVAKKVDTKIEYMKLDEAKSKGAMALFEDKYDDVVRVVTMDDSIELCGGTHVKNTGDVEKIAILSIENKGSDTFRLVGTTASNVKECVEEELQIYQNEMLTLLDKSKKILSDAKNRNFDLTFDFIPQNEYIGSYQDIVNMKNTIIVLREEVKKLEKKYNDLKTQKLLSNADKFLTIKEQINNKEVIVSICEGYEIPVLKQMVDNLCNSLSNGFVLLANLKEGNVNFICKSNPNNTDIHCGNIVRELANKCNGNGGGNAIFAQGGGTKIDDIQELLKEIKNKL